MYCRKSNEPQIQRRVFPHLVIGRNQNCLTSQFLYDHLHGFRQWIILQFVYAAHYRWPHLNVVLFLYVQQLSRANCEIFWKNVFIKAFAPLRLYTSKRDSYFYLSTRSLGFKRIEADYTKTFRSNCCLSANGANGLPRKFFLFLVFRHAPQHDALSTNKEPTTLKDNP